MKSLILAICLSICVSCATHEKKHSPQSIVKSFTKHYVNSDPSRPFAAKFLGVESWQNPADLWVMQEIISEVRPDIIIETGTAMGGTALYFANLMDYLKVPGKIYTIDIFPQIDTSITKIKNKKSQQRAKFLSKTYIEVIKSNSIDPKLIHRLSKHIEGKKVLVTLDSCHNSQHVKKELELYSKFVSLGSYLIVQDTVIDEDERWIKRFASCPGYKLEGGPGLALSQFMKDNNLFVSDVSREKFLLTFHKSGYLKRVK